MARLMDGLQILNSGGIPGVFVTEVFTPTDPRGIDSAFYIPKAKEIKGLMYKGTFEAVSKSEIVKGANILGGSFVLYIRGI